MAGRLGRTSLGILLCICANAAIAFDLQGHRGARGLMPENTLPAFAKALSLGVSTLELDTVVTSDGVVVVSHDPTLNPALTRVADGKWLDGRGPALNALTFRALCGYDVGRLNAEHRYTRRWPEQVAVDGTRIPALADVFALARRTGNDRVHFNIETKIKPHAPDETPDPENFARAVLNVVWEVNAVDRVTPFSPSTGVPCRRCSGWHPRFRPSISPRSNAGSTMSGKGRRVHRPGPRVSISTIMAAACRAW